MAINKVKFGNQTLIDLTDTTATADKILTGFGAYGKDGVWMDGTAVVGSGAVADEVTQLPGGGDHHNVTGVDLTLDTVTAGSMLSGVTAHDSAGNAITGTIATKTSSNLTVSRNTVTAPAGYYAESASKAVSSGGVNAPTLYNNIPPTILVSSGGLITATVPNITLSYGSNEGYVYDSTQTATIQMSQTGKTYTATKQLTTKAATTYTPTTTSQTIASETYLTGAQTISGDSNLVAENIKKDVNIFGVTGTYEGGATYTATITPMSTGTVGGAYARYPGSSGTKYYTRGDTFGIEAGTVIFLYAMAERSEAGIYVNGTRVAYSSMYDGGTTSYNYTVPANTNVSIQLSYGTATYIYVTEEQSIINVTENGLHNVSEYDYANVNVLPVTEKDVNFYDYDGTLLYAYTAQEFANLSELPSNPSHEGLVAQGWNWTKTYIDNQLTGAPGGIVKVGQLYITESGNTEIDIDLTDTPRLSPTLCICVNGTITVDWGDNTTPDTVTGSSASTTLTVAHTYRASGNYTISIHADSGNYRFYNSSSGGTLFKRDTSSTGINASFVYLNKVKRIRFGNGIYTAGIGNYAFQYCRGLESVTIPTTFSTSSYTFYYCSSLKCVVLPTSANINTYFVNYSGVEHVIPGQQCSSISAYAFSNCLNLASITIPYYVSSFGNYIFQGCDRLQRAIIPSNTRATILSQGMFNSCDRLTTVIIPEKITTINGSCFYTCYSLSTLTLPSTVTTVSASAFSSDYGMKEYHFLSTTPPSLSSDSFNSIPDDCVIYVPSASLSDYQTATNWSTYASRMVGE